MSTSSSNSDDKSNNVRIKFLALASCYVHVCRRRKIVRVSNPCRTCSLKGHDWVMNVFNRNLIRCHESFRMFVDVFKRLCRVLRDDYKLTC